MRPEGDYGSYAYEDFEGGGPEYAGYAYDYEPLEGHAANPTPPTRRVTSEYATCI